MDSALERAGHDLEAWEVFIRSAVLEQGAKGLQTAMNAIGSRSFAPCCPRCRVSMQSTGLRTKTILTLTGPVSYTRRRYACPACSNQACYPADQALGISNTSRSPGVQRQVARLGAKEPFHEVAEDLRELAGLTLSRKDAERIAEAIGGDIEQRDAREREKIRRQQAPAPEVAKTIDTLYIEMDGTGAPMVPWEVQGRKGKQPDGSAKTREVKLGCVFTQTCVDEQGRAVRDPNTTVFTGAIEEAAVFGQRMYAETVRNGLYLVKRVVILADGAEWIKKLAELHFPMAQRIIDLYHAKEHVATLAKALFSKPVQASDYREHWWALLLERDIEAILEQASKRMPPNHEDNKEALRELNYLKNNREQMRYARFRSQGLFIGSGIIEAGCKNVVCKRLKQSGMEWTVRGANNIVALRCAILSRRFTDYWEARAA